MTPKGLLRLKEASSSLSDLAEGTFQPVIDAVAPDKAQVRRLVFCSGKIYYDIVGHEAARETAEIAVARIEQLYPFPVGAVRELIASYPALDEVVWAQEEPQNMGAWRTIRHRLEEAAAGAPVRYVGRPWRASTAEGYPTAHSLEQERIAVAVLTLLTRLSGRAACAVVGSRGRQATVRAGAQESRNGHARPVGATARGSRRAPPSSGHCGDVACRCGSAFPDCHCNAGGCKPERDRR